MEEKAEESGNAQAPVNDIQVEGEGSENVNAQAPVDTKDIHALGVADKEDAAATDEKNEPVKGEKFRENCLKYRNYMIGGAVGLLLVIIIAAAALTAGGGGGGSGSPCDFKSQILSVNKKYFALNDVIATKTLPVMVEINFWGYYKKNDQGQTAYDPFTEKDYIGNFMIAHGKASNGGDPRDGVKGFSDRDNVVEYRTVSNAAGESYPCFQVTEVLDPADRFTAFPSQMAYKFSKPTGVYYYEAGAFTLHKQVNDIPENGWADIGITVERKKLPSQLVCFVEGDIAPPETFETKDEAQYEDIFSSDLMDIRRTVYALPDGSSPRTTADYNQSPTDHVNTYGDRKHFHYLGKTAEGGARVAWQDKNKAVYLTTINEFTTTQTSVGLTIEGGHDLGCAIEGKDGEFFYVTIQVNENRDKKDSFVDVQLYKASSLDGNVIQKNKPDTSQEGLNFHSWGAYDSCSLIFEPKTPFLAFHYARTMVRGPDGMNHQAAAIEFFDVDTLKVAPKTNKPERAKDYLKQTGSHSWGANVYLGSDGKVVGMELGDQYPRGVTMWRADLGFGSFKLKTCYGVKVKHGEEANPFGQKTFPPYPEAGAGFYQWSNDNQVYTELASRGFHENEDSYSVFFLSEQPALDNSQAKAKLNAPRNIGFFKVKKDLSEVLSPGPVEKGGWYDFGGKWTAFEHKGINWLTSGTDKKSTLNKLKTMQVGTSGKYVLLLFEVWDSTKPHDDDKYRHTAYKIVDKDGNDHGSGYICEMCYNMRLMRTDDPIQISNNEILLVSGTADGKLSTFKITIKNLD